MMSRRVRVLASGLVVATAGLTQLVRADEPEPTSEPTPEPTSEPAPEPAPEPKLEVVAADPELHFSMLDEGDTASDPDDEFRAYKDGTETHEDTVSIDFDGQMRDASDARVKIVEQTFPDAAAATMAWVLTNTKDGTRRTMVISNENGWFAWSDGTSTDIYMRAEDGSVLVNGEPFAEFKERPAGPLYRKATPAVIAAWVGLSKSHFNALDRAFPTAVNDQVTDSVTQANTKVLGEAPALAMGNLYTATSQALAAAAQNATSAQQQTYVVAQAATSMGVSLLYSVDTASPSSPKFWMGF